MNTKRVKALRGMLRGVNLAIQERQKENKSVEELQILRQRIIDRGLQARLAEEQKTLDVVSQVFAQAEIVKKEG
jgi:hypothetical protein